MNSKKNMSTSIYPKVERKKHKSFHCLLTVILLAAAFFLGSAFVVSNCKEIFRWGVLSRSKMCETRDRLYGSETLPEGIVSGTSDLKMRPLSGPGNEKNSKTPMNLLAIAAGIKQKESVDKIVKKFPPSDFVVMLFHYDGIVDDWRDLEWSAQAIHVSAINQTKWWFAKRFLHPDIVSGYAYIFLWDEDLGVDNFNAKRYLSIIREEGLEISQPALDPEYSELHHQLTARDNRTRVHRRIVKVIGGGRRCHENSTNPPCTGFVEMMAPVFSRASWCCAWHMIQNDLVHAWGLDFQLGYCAQGDPTKNIGIVDSEYVVHYGLPTLGGPALKIRQPTNMQSTVALSFVLVTNSQWQSSMQTNSETPDLVAQNENLASSKQQVTLSNQPTSRNEVRKRSYVELEIFKNRWKKAVKEDDCWIYSLKE
ncbi:uncharacterized protein LOC116106143 [Pistacia vera]|uniref:uncharacterized protein LOC116106143 n=1 Tax=Pistacia vera TaxID=55513 RepID=UPI001262F7CA|nr:uncharacterized protein LOC116106143 [Pistacia vera]